VTFNRRLYDYIVRQFLASVSADCKYIRTKIVLRIGDEAFLSRIFP